MCIIHASLSVKYVLKPIRERGGFFRLVCCVDSQYGQNMHILKYWCGLLIPYVTLVSPGHEGVIRIVWPNFNMLGLSYVITLGIHCCWMSTWSLKSGSLLEWTPKRSVNSISPLSIMWIIIIVQDMNIDRTFLEAYHLVTSLFWCWTYDNISAPIVCISQTA